MTQTRRNPIDRKREILGHALVVARRIGYQRVTRGDIAEQAGCTAPLISHYFTTIGNMQRAIMGEAIRVGDLDVIAQGLVAKDPRAEGLKEEIKIAAANRLAGL